MPDRHKLVIRLVAVVGLLVAVAFAVDLDAAITSLLDADLSLTIFAIILVQGQIVLSAYRWHFTTKRLGRPLPIGRAISEYYLASLLNMLLPGGVGGDAVRATREGKAREGAADKAYGVAASAVILERLAGQVAFFMVAAIGIACWPLLLGDTLPVGTGWLVAAPPLILGSLVLLVWVGTRLAPRPLANWLKTLGPSIRKAWLTDSAWLIQAALSFAIALLYIAVFALASAAIGAPLGLLAAAALIPLVLLTMLVPISIGGFGLREGAAAALWPLAGFAGSDGLAAALLYGVVSIVGALPGALVLLKRSSAASSRA